MNYSSLPSFVLPRLLALDESVVYLSAKEANIAEEIEEIRKRLDGRVVDQRDDPDQLQERLQQLLTGQKHVKARLDGTQRLISSCRAWLDRLPDGAKLEQVKANTEGKELADVRAQIKAARDELKMLKRAPVPSPDLRQRIERRVAALGSPTVRGIGQGETLKIFWPGAKETISGHDERSCDPLALFSVLFPEKLVDAVMAEVERMTSEPLPLAQRPAQIAAVEREIEGLSHVEEALVELALARGEPVHRSGSALPQAVLGVRVVERARAA
jgi:hypothetical protein